MRKGNPEAAADVSSVMRQVAKTGAGAQFSAMKPVMAYFASTSYLQLLQSVFLSFFFLPSYLLVCLSVHLSIYLTNNPPTFFLLYYLDYFFLSRFLFLPHLILLFFLCLVWGWIRIFRDKAPPSQQRNESTGEGDPLFEVKGDYKLCDRLHKFISKNRSHHL
jgi:hypothetical protein